MPLRVENNVAAPERGQHVVVPGQRLEVALGVAVEGCMFAHPRVHGYGSSGTWQENGS